MKMFQQLGSTKRWITIAGAVVFFAVVLVIGARIALACPRPPVPDCVPQFGTCDDCGGDTKEHACMNCKACCSFADTDAAEIACNNLQCVGTNGPCHS